MKYFFLFQDKEGHQSTQVLKNFETPMYLSDWASTVLAGISALAAAVAIYVPWRTQKSQKILDQATITLERAYEVLSCGGNKIQPPAPDRLNWITCARNIEQYRNLKKLIKNKEHQLVCEGQEEYWRHKFYLYLNMPNPLLLEFYKKPRQPHKGLGINPKSAIIIHDFASFPDNKKDPLNLANIDAILERGKVLQENIGLNLYLKSLQEYSEKIRPDAKPCKLHNHKNIMSYLFLFNAHTEYWNRLWAKITLKE